MEYGSRPTAEDLYVGPSPRAGTCYQIGNTVSVHVASRNLNSAVITRTEWWKTVKYRSVTIKNDRI